MTILEVFVNLNSTIFHYKGGLGLDVRNIATITQIILRIETQIASIERKQILMNLFECLLLTEPHFASIKDHVFCEDFVLEHSLVLISQI